MKKIFTLALLAMMGIGSASAQKDVTNLYIRNATLSSLSGWTNNGFNGGQKGNNTTGYASEAYAGWAGLEKTAYSLKQDITLPAGHYTLVNYSFYREGEGAMTDPETSRAFLLAGDQKVAIKTLGSITAPSYANSQAEGANVFDSKMYRNTLDFTVDADNTTVTIGLEGTFEVMRSWCIAGMFELIDNDQLATMDSPFDVTGYIVNPGFEYRDMTGWTLSEDGAFGTQSNSQSFKVGGYYAEKWQPTNDGALTARSMSQTVSGLPAGFYQLTANLGGDGTYLGLNGKTVNWTSDGNYTTGCVIAEGEDLVITAGKTEEGTANWVHFDNFKLLYGGDIAASLDALVSQANSLNKPMYIEVKDELNAAVEAATAVSGEVESYLEAINNLSAAIDNAKASIAAYEKLFAALEDGEAFIAKAVENGAPTTVEDALSEMWVNYEEGMIADANIDAEIAKIDAILVSVTRQQTKVGSDMTRLLVNPNYDLGETGWTVEAAPGSGPDGRQGNVRPGGSADNLCYEAWNNANFDIYQEVPEAPVGVYEISVQGFYRYGRGNAWNDYLAQTVEYVKPAGVPVYIYLNNNPTNFTNIYGDPVQITDETFYSAGSTDWVSESKDGTTYYFPNGMASAAIAFSADMYTQSAFGLVAREGDQLRIGVKGNSNQLNDSWVIWDNFKLTYRGFDPDVIKPVLEAAAEDVDTLYMGLLMGKSEYAALTKALSDAQTAIANNDGEAMFNALNDLYDAKDPARISKDIFLEQEVAADTLRMAEAIRAIEGLKLANSTKAAADELLNGLINNLIYENDEIDQLKEDVTSMIDRLYNSVDLYSQLNGAISDLNVVISEAEATTPAISAELISEAKALADEAKKGYDDGSFDDDQVSPEITKIDDMIERLRNAISIATGINAVTNDGVKADAYNVGGQKVNAQKGLVIKNSKKVVVK